ncbi:MAG: hypothetical protein K8S16_19295 [Bacteroidales bacterium]|nr:hypothetical protein [Bacteroidales bacterium]
MKTLKPNFFILFMVSFLFSNAQISDDSPDFYTQNIDYNRKSPGTLPTDNTSFNWSYTGPGELNTNNKGIIVSLYIDPADINKIYAGTTP